MNGVMPLPDGMSADDYALLKAFRPRLRYDSQAVFLALSAAAMTDNPGNELRRRKTPRAWADGVPPLNIATLTEPGNTRRDRLHQSSERVHDALRMQTDRRYADTVHGAVHRHGDSIYLQYWLFFYGTETGSLGARPRDSCVWRLIQVELDAERQPKALVVENERYRRRRWRDVKTVGERHPVVYIAPRAQYLYFEPGACWRGFDYDGSDGGGADVLPRLILFEGWEKWPGKWGGSLSPAAGTGWTSPQRLGRTADDIMSALAAAYVWGFLLPFRLLSRYLGKSRDATFNARLERDQVVVGYRIERSTVEYLTLTAHQGRRTIAARQVADVQESGEEALPLRAKHDSCELRVTSCDASGRRTRYQAIPLSLNEPDAVEAGILEEVVRTQLENSEVVRFARHLRVDPAALRHRLDASHTRIWSSVASELQTFRDARSRQSRRRNADALVARARGMVMIAGAAVALVATALSALWLLSDDSMLVLNGGMIAAVLGLGAIGVGWSQWRRWVAARREGLEAGDPTEDTALVAARRSFERALREKGVAPIIREELNASTMDGYTDRLRFGDEGLSELRTVDYEISTHAADRLAQLTRRMRGGSIGIAGPRGAGKTTLIESFCTPRTADDRRLMTVIAAPVRYEARDFVLTLFARLCEATLGSGRAELRDDAPTSARLVTSAAPVIPLLILAGLLAWLVTEWKAATPTRLAVAGLCLATFVIVLGLVRGVPWKSYGIVASVALITAVVLVLVALRGEMDVVPDLYLGWTAFGLTLLVIGLALVSRPPPQPALSTDADERLSAQAEAHLRNIRFQQSYSTGYSGKLSLAGGAEASVQTREDLAQKQESLPEIVEQLRSFLALAAAARGGVAIGIDEMDKMESAELAQQFLNEIKGIFGVEGCFYLVSISENAMASFERRGLPLRDVFDSSFDEVLYVGPLTLWESKLLLRGRVVGLGPPYLDLCHSLSGGLARDVLRVARQLSLHNPKPGGRPLRMPVAVKRIVAAEMKRKVAAIKVAAQRVELEPHVSELLFWVRDVERAKADAAALLDCCATQPRNWPRSPETMEPAETKEAGTLERLRIELATFAYFAATLLELYGDDGNLETRIRRAEVGEHTARSRLEALALARIELGVNALVAVEMVNEFRRDQKTWDVLSFASPHPTVAEPTEAATLAHEPTPLVGDSGVGPRQDHAAEPEEPEEHDPPGEGSPG